MVRVQPGRDTLVIGDDGKPIAPGSDAVGKLARTGNVPLGYYKDAEEDARRPSSATRAAATRSPATSRRSRRTASIVLLGRGSVCINSGGEKVFPEEVEAALKAHPEVFDVVVVGVRDERWGERVAAVLQPRAGHTPSLEALAAHCRDKIAGYKIPRALYLVERIERSPSGKPDYPWAKALAAERAAERAIPAVLNRRLACARRSATASASTSRSSPSATAATWWPPSRRRAASACWAPSPSRPSSSRSSSTGSTSTSAASPTASTS